MFQVHQIPSDYDGWKVALKGATFRKVAHNTTAENVGWYIAIKYHRTTIARFYPDGCMWVNTGGWQTPTTKTRLNVMLGKRDNISQRDWKWYWRDGEPFDDMTFLDVAGYRYAVGFDCECHPKI